MNCEGLMESACVTPRSGFRLRSWRQLLFENITWDYNQILIKNHATSPSVLYLGSTSDFLKHGGGLWQSHHLQSSQEIFRLRLNFGLFFPRIFFNFTRKNVTEFTCRMISYLLCYTNRGAAGFLISGTRLWPNNHGAGGHHDWPSSILLFDFTPLPDAPKMNQKLKTFLL